MNTFLLSFLITSVTLLIIFTLEFLKEKTAAKKRFPPKFVDCGLGLRGGNNVYFKGLWIRPAFITPFESNEDFQFLLVNSCIHPVIFHAICGDNSDGKGWHIYQVEYSTELEMLKEANRIIDSSKKNKQ